MKTENAWTERKRGGGALKMFVKTSKSGYRQDATNVNALWEKKR